MQSQAVCLQMHSVCWDLHAMQMFSNTADADSSEQASVQTVGEDMVRLGLPCLLLILSVWEG
jgi:hypothetical protein